MLIINQPLRKNNIELRLLDEQFTNKLLEISSDKRIWQYSPDKFEDPVIFKNKWLYKATQQMQQQERVCFIVFYQNEIVGSSSYYEINPSNRKLNIGYTWLHPQYWGSGINALLKLTMLEHAFETLHYLRVGFSVDSRNIPSCQALTKLGIKQEGLLRNHLLLSDGTRRHSAMFSVIAEEWPTVKNHIQTIIR